MAVGDFNNDNYLDLVVANSGADNIGIFIGLGNRSFISQITYSTGFGSHPYSIAVGDFNSDGQLDVVTANYGTNNIGLFLGDGNESFIYQSIFSLNSSRPLFLTTADFNNDNRMDLVVANYGTSNIVLLLGLGDGVFRLSGIYDMGFDAIPYSIAVADFNKDSHLDIAIVTYGTSNLVILLADGNMNFTSSTFSTETNSYPCSIAVGDFNNDNNWDIVVANSNVLVYLGYGNGTFREKITHLLDSISRSRFIVVGDFNNDHKPDLILADSGNSNILGLKGYGNGSFSLLMKHSTGYNSYPSSITLGDFDGDNKIDIVVSNNGTNNILLLSSFAVYTNTSQMTYSTGNNSAPNSVAVGYFNNDNYLDIAVANSNSDTIGIFLGFGNGTFKNVATYFIGSSTTANTPYSLAIGDFNNDNKSDIVVALRSISLVGFLLGNGDGTFTIAYAYFIGYISYPDWVAVGNFNNDRYLDIITANYGYSTVSVFLLSGNRQYLSVKTYSTGDGSFPSSIAIGDLNNDNITDFIVANLYSRTISIHLGYGNGSFRNAIIMSTNEDYPSCITTDDLNNDRILDIVFINRLACSVGVLLGLGNATFGNITTYFTGYGSYLTSVGLSDFNNDGFLDIIVTNGWHFNIGLFLGYGNGMFATQQVFSTGSGSFPVAIAFGDFNNDNQSDIVVANSFTNTFGIFLVNDVTDFIQTTNYLTGSSTHPYSVVVGNFNNNSQLDIAVVNSGTNDLQILMDYNNGIFMNTTTYSINSNSHPQHVIVADFNKDNQLDIATVNHWNDSISIFVGLGNGLFNPATEYSTGSGSFPSSMTVGDFNNDNWIDIVVANQAANNVGIFLRFDYPIFSSYNIYFDRTLSLPVYVVTADFNNDSCWDIAIANSGSDKIGILLGYGNGMFSKPVLYSVGNGSTPTSIAVGDFNNDYHVDIAVANSKGYGISIFLGNGNGTFVEQMLYSTKPFSPISIATGDFNNDNRLDIVVANPNNNHIGISFGFGNGSFAEEILYWMPDKSTPIYVTVSDFNKDNILDIVVANRDGNTIGILLGYGNGTFYNVTTYSTGQNSSPRSIAIGDINRDGTMDIVVANLYSKTIGIFFGNDDGTFLPQKTQFIGNTSSLTSIALAKINNDTLLDIIVTDYANDDSHIGILYGLIDGNFAALQTYSTGVTSNPVSVVICDFNSDNRADLAVANSNTDNVGILLQTTTTLFGTQTTFSTGNNSQPSSVAVGDFNNDDQLDIAVVNSGMNNIGILLGYNNGSFADQKTYSTGDNSYPTSIIIGDFNNDKQLDFAITNSDSNNIGIYLGYGNGNFVITTSYSTGQSSVPSSIAAGDLNKDNYLDLIVTNWGTNNFLIFSGLGDGSFSDPISYSVGYDARPQFVTIGDFNNDTRLDIVIVNYGTNNINIFLQSC